MPLAKRFFLSFLRVLRGDINQTAPDSESLQDGDLRRPARLDFFRVFGVFRGLDSSPDWVAGDARARFSETSVANRKCVQAVIFKLT